jgi:hypothetical protein
LPSSCLWSFLSSESPWPSTGSLNHLTGFSYLVPSYDLGNFIQVRLFLSIIWPNNHMVNHIEAIVNLNEMDTLSRWHKNETNKFGAKS